MADVQAPVSTKGRCIQIKSGLSADFSDDVLKVAEFGLILDTNELRIGLADGSTMKVNGGGININDIPDASLSQKGLMTQAHVVKLDGISSGANFVQVEDNLTSTSTTSALSAKQGKVLKDAIDAVGSGGNGGGSGGEISNIYQNNVTTSPTGTAFGYNTSATGSYSNTEGNNTVAAGTYSHAEGYHTRSRTYASHASGQFNKNLNGSSTDFQITADAFVIGNGTSVTTISNAFRVKFDGSAYGLSAFNSSGADYAEYFEWLDSNPNNEDRVGHFVTLIGDKIEIANSTSDYIIGVISANPSVIGDSHQDQWQGMYVRDEWGRIQNEYVDVEYEEFDNEGNPIIKTRQDYVHKLNPDFNNEEEYIGRENRQEWDAVGMLGKLLVRDDGTCEVNSYAKVADGGIATKSDTGYRVIKRINENIIQIIFK